MALSKHLQTLISLFSLVALFLMLANKVRSEDETYFSFDAFVQNPSDLTYQGDAHVPSGSSVLRLTKTDSSNNPESLSVGRVVYSKTIQFWEVRPTKPDPRQLRVATFETTIKFVIKPSRDGAAEGIAFFIAPVNTTIPFGSSGGNLGIIGLARIAPWANRLFAVEFDTHVNPEWDPNHRHIGIDINSIVSEVTTSFDSATGKEVTARINYDGNTRTIRVIATSGSQTASLSYVYDLTCVLDEQVQVGISSATGQSPSVQGIHDVHSWYFNSTLVDTLEKPCSKNEETYIRQNVPM